MKAIQLGDLALFQSSDHKTYLQPLVAGESLQTHRGIVAYDDLVGIPWGSKIRSHMGTTFTVNKPTIRDVLLQIRRSSQIIYPKDLGYILLRLNAGPGKTIAEAGTGSGALTMALAWAVGSAGKVISYDRREDMQTLARRNLEKIGMADRVEFRQKDLGEGLGKDPLDAFFLDVPNAHHYITKIRPMLPSGIPFGAILPTTNQVSALIQVLQAENFTNIDVCEIMLRFYKTNPARIRPMDRMVAHTGYLLFAAPMPLENSEADNLDLT